jgi:hypothetical protein
MKILLLVVLLVIIAILGCALGHEVVQKNRIAKQWQQFVIKESVRNYQNLDHGDVDKVKVSLMLVADLEAEVYEKKYGYGTDTNFASKLMEAKQIYSAYQATNRPSK